MSIRFKFNPEKAVETAALFLKLRGNKNSMKYLGLVKLLYTADRIAFERLDQPITGDSYVAKKFGPVLSNVYDLIKGKDDNNIWFEYISTNFSNYEVQLKADPGINHLSRVELRIIQEVYEAVGHLDRFELAEKTHQEFPEWKNPLPAAKSAPIYIEEILRQLGKNDDEIRGIGEEAEKEAFLDAVLNA